MTSSMDHLPCKQGMEMAARSPAAVLFLLSKNAVSVLTGLLINSFCKQFPAYLFLDHFQTFPFIAKDFLAKA